jgi:Uma2 family endonuclease
MGMPLPQQRRWTRAEVVALIDANPLVTPRYELVDGELLVTPSPSRRHQFVVAELLHALLRYLKSDRVARAVTSPSDLRLEEESLVQPDVYVVPRGGPGKIGDGDLDAVLLAIEVLSPSSRHIDRGRKRLLHQRRVPEYWIVDIDTRSIERWRSDDAEPEVLADRIVWQPPGATRPLVLDIPSLLAEALDD